MAEPAENGAAPGFPGWPEAVRNNAETILGTDPDDLAQRGRLGEELAFGEVPPLMRTIHSLVADVGEESWDELPPSLANGELNSNLAETITGINGMQSFSPAEQANAVEARDNLTNEFRAKADWFKERLPPYIRRAPLERMLAGQQVDADLTDLTRRIEALNERTNEVNRQVESNADLVKGLRRVSGKQAASEFAQMFADRADELSESAQKWLYALLATGVVAFAGSIAAFLLLRPDTNTNEVTGSDLAQISLLVLVAGLLLYGVRVCAQGYRSTRHLQAIARSKETALSTFVPFSNQFDSDEIRAAVALALAQAAFATEDTGLIDGSSDQITLVERALAPRITGGGG